MVFEHEKKVCIGKLYGPDRSKKGSVDDEIILLIDCINSLDNFYTTSSCAGRIVLITIPDNKRKDASEWIFVSHKKIRFQDLPLDKLPKDILWFRQEALILHVCCKTLESAQDIVDKAKYSGFKRSGIMATKKRIMVEICGTEKIDAPVSEKGKLLVDTRYIKKLISEANKKMEINKKKIDKFYRLLKK